MHLVSLLNLYNQTFFDILSIYLLYIILYRILHICIKSILHQLRLLSELSLLLYGMGLFSGGEGVGMTCWMDAGGH